jgi:hypothetical protein
MRQLLRVFAFEVRLFACSRSPSFAQSQVMTMPSIACRPTEVLSVRIGLMRVLYVCTSVLVALLAVAVLGMVVSRCPSVDVRV